MLGLAPSEPRQRMMAAGPGLATSSRRPAAPLLFCPDLSVLMLVALRAVLAGG